MKEPASARHSSFVLRTSFVLGYFGLRASRVTSFVIRASDFLRAWVIRASGFPGHVIRHSCFGIPSSLGISCFVLPAGSFRASCFPEARVELPERPQGHCEENAGDLAGRGRKAGRSEFRRDLFKFLPLAIIERDLFSPGSAGQGGSPARRLQATQQFLLDLKKRQPTPGAGVR
jgi:hypothetical protein